MISISVASDVIAPATTRILLLQPFRLILNCGSHSNWRSRKIP
jgi:hypothetical protein